MSDDILSRIDEAMARNAERFDPLAGQRHAPGVGDEMRWKPGPDGTEKAADDRSGLTCAGCGRRIYAVTAWVAAERLCLTCATGTALPLGAASPASFRCRGCRLWIAQDVPLCGPCSALPPCSAERLRAEWGLVLCFRPDGHDGQHESVEGRCWMDPPSQAEAGGYRACMDRLASPVESPRQEPFLMAAIDAESGLLGERIDDAMASLLRQHAEHFHTSLSEAPVRLPWWKRLFQ